ncbi:hypothetical protein, partial [Staphylococcus hominis]|uniref:hypothetical protein n=1 Tax=Staphylococcus hominis TaxID=1290 RepID=UPI000D4E2DA1
VNKSDAFKSDGSKDAAEIPSLCTTLVEFPIGHSILKMIEKDGRIGVQHIYSYNNNLFVHQTTGDYSPSCEIYWDTWSGKPTQRLQEALRVFESYKGG